MLRLWVQAISVASFLFLTGRTSGWWWGWWCAQELSVPIFYSTMSVKNKLACTSSLHVLDSMNQKLHKENTTQYINSTGKSSCHCCWWCSGACMAPEGIHNRNWPRVLCLTISLNFYHCYHFVCISSILYFSCWVLATNLKLVSSTTVQEKKKMEIVLLLGYLVACQCTCYPSSLT